MENSNDPIKHVVLLKLENHSFDQMLGALKKVHPNLDGPSPTNFNEDREGKKFFQIEMDYLQMEHDPGHEFDNVEHQLSDGNKGFVKNYQKYVADHTDEQKQKIMAYYSLGALPALHTLGEHFTVCDKWFSPVPGPTWPNRFFALTGTTLGFVKMPGNGTDFEMAYNQKQATIFDRLNEKQKTWKVFYYDLPCSLILCNQRRAENVKNYELVESFFDLCENKPESAFPEFCLIEPKYFGIDQNDDHPPHNIMKAQKLIADVYNAISSNQGLFESTLLIVTYDEHGGFYDHVSPPEAVAPDENSNQFAFNRYGVRVPAILISPWVKAGVLSRVFDHTSVLKYLQQKWGLGELGKRTAAANSIGEAIQDTIRDYKSLPGFIRIPNSKLYADQPELEENAANGNRDAMAAFWKGMESGSFAAGIEVFKENALQWERDKKAATNWKFQLGSFFVGWGRSLQSAGRREIAKQNELMVPPDELTRVVGKIDKILRQPK